MILGCMNFGKADWGIPRKSAEDILDTAFECGIRKFDTASFYAGGLSEKILGGWIKDSGCRDSVEVMSKAGGGDPDNTSTKGLSADCLVRSTESSLRRLGLSRLDTLTLHWPDPDSSVNDTLDGITNLLERGLIRNWALSNFYTGETVRFLERALIREMPLPKYNHVHLNLLEQHALKELVPETNLYGVSTLAWSPLCGGILCDSFRNTNPRFHSKGSFWKRYSENSWLERRNYLVSIADDHGVSLEHLALGWLVHWGVEPIFGAETKNEILLLTSLDFSGFSPEISNLLTQSGEVQYPHDVLNFSGVHLRSKGLI